MTTDHRIIFEPADVRSFVFECADCGGSTSVTGGNDLRHGDEIVTCPSCGKRWMADYEGANLYRKLFFAWRDVMTAQENEKAFKLRLVLDATTP